MKKILTSEPDLFYVQKSLTCYHDDIQKRDK